MATEKVFCSSIHLIFLGVTVLQGFIQIVEELVYEQLEAPSVDDGMVNSNDNIAAVL